MIATLFRILLTPVIVVVILLQPPFWNWIAAGIFITASITDWLDGYWARKYQAVTTAGKFLDPIADKILVSSVLILLIPLGRIEALAVLLLLNRDIIVGGLRSIAASHGQVIAAGSLGKWKTAIQMVAIPMLLIYFPLFHIPLGTIGYWGIWASVALSLISGFQYLMGYLKNPELTRS